MDPTYDRPNNFTNMQIQKCHDILRPLVTTIIKDVTSFEIFNWLKAKNVRNMREVEKVSTFW